MNRALSWPAASSEPEQYTQVSVRPEGLFSWELEAEAQNSSLFLTIRFVPRAVAVRYARAVLRRAQRVATETVS